MPRTCAICTHPKRAEINEALVGAEPSRRVASRFGVGKSAIYRHQQEHLPAALSLATKAKEAVEGDALLDKVGRLEAEAQRIGKLAEDAGDLRTAMAGVRELRGIVELLAKLIGRFDGPRASATVRAVVVMPGVAGPIEPGRLAVEIDLRK